MPLDVISFLFARRALRRPPVPPFPVERTWHYGEVLPSALNAEVPVVVFPPQRGDYVVEGYVDVSKLERGEMAILREYISIDGETVKKFLEIGVVGPASEPIIRFHPKSLPYFAIYKVTLTQTSGELRKFPFAFVIDVLKQA